MASTRRITHEDFTALRAFLGLALLLAPCAAAAEPTALPALQGETAKRYLAQQGLSAPLDEAIRTAPYAALPVEADGSYAAQNPAQGMNAGFSQRGLTLRGAGARGRQWETVWILRSVGYGARQVPVGDGALNSRGNRVEIGRRLSAGEREVVITEWYENRPAGLEQGFRLSAAPASNSGGEPLRLVMELEGDLRARAAANGQSLELLRAGGSLALRYDHLKVVDASGKLLPSRMGSSGNEVFIEVEDDGAAWPLTIDPTFSQQAYLKASNADAGDQFGYTVAISGDTVVVGTWLEASNGTGPSDNSAAQAGAAYVFVRNGAGTWTQQAYLKASNAEALDRFGITVGISGNTVVVGANLEDGNGSSESDNSASNAGAAYVFVRNGAGVWSQQAYLKASNAQTGDLFGSTVAIAGDTLVVGAYLEDSDGSSEANNSAVNSGAAYVFVRNGAGVWTQQGYLKASNAGAGDFFGYGVPGTIGISGDTVVVGAWLEDSNGSGQTDNSASNSGAAYVFVRNGAGVWSQQAYLKASNPDPEDHFGLDVGVSGDTVVVGANAEDSNGSGQSNNSAENAGAAYVFVRNGAGVWTQQAYLKASNAEVFDFFGAGVGISGDRLVVGAVGEDGDGSSESDNSAPGASAAYVFARDGAGVWSQQAYLKASNAEAAESGFSLAVGISGDTVVAGFDFEDSNGTSESDNSAPNAGAAYVFREGPAPNTAPTITAVPVSVSQNTSAPGQLVAMVADTEDAAGNLTVSVQSANPSNGVTLSNLVVEPSGNVKANIAASCTAANGLFTLRVTDTGSKFADAALAVTVTPETGAPQATAAVGLSSLWPANNDLLNVGLGGSATDQCDASPDLRVDVYSNESDTAGGAHSPDAKAVGNTLRLRAERLGGGNGRVYLIVVTATDDAGNKGVAATTVVVPKSNAAQWRNQVAAMAQAARNYALSNAGAPPPGYVVVGGGPVMGPKQ